MSTFVDYLTNLGFDAGKDFLIDKKREKEAKKRIFDYIEMQADINELCTLAEEIDFGGIIEYLSTDLLEDVKIYLFAEKDSRKNMKSTILLKAINWAQANTNIQKERVEKVIEDSLKILKAFYRNQVHNTDLFFVAAEIIDSIDKSINNTSENLSKKMDNIALDISEIKNKESFSKVLETNNCEHTNVNSLFQKLNDFIMKHYIKEKYRDNGLSNEEIENYSELFKLSINIFGNNKPVKTDKNIFDFIREDILTQNKKNLIKVKGPDGMGKSTFLSILYIYLYRYCLQNGFKFFPFYINLHYYDKITNTFPDKVQAVKNIMEKDLENLKKIVQEYPDLSYIFIVDGKENYYKKVLKSDKAFDDFIEDIPGRKNIICISQRTTVYSFCKREIFTFVPRKISYVFKFKPINNYEKEKRERFIDMFISLEGNEDMKNIINMFLNKFDLEEIDLNILNILKECYEVDLLDEKSSISDVFKTYCMTYLGDEDLFEECAKMAYEYFLEGKDFQQEEISQNIKMWNLIHQHKTISNFLIAYHFVKKIKHYKCKENYNSISYLFPMDTNIFIKPLINEDVETQRTIFNNCVKVYANEDILAKAQALYMIGRITHKSLRSKILKTLEGYFEELYFKLTECAEWKSKQEERDLHLLLRSVIISLVYLGKKDKREIYLKILLTYPMANQINRSFHLEYYGDVQRQPSNTYYYYGDDGTEKIDITYHILLNRIERYLSATKGKEDYNFQINLFTLCSLLQVRLGKSVLSIERVNKLREVIEIVLEKEEYEINKDFKAYLIMLKDDIGQETYLPRCLFDKLYGLKGITRSGWKKEIQNNFEKLPYENVAEHIYYTWMLGMLYLPEEKPEEDGYNSYSKRKILDLILIHDWAEIDVGDIVPSDDSDAHREEEDLRMRILFMHDTYDKIGNMAEYKKLWNVYGKNSTDINGKLAYELDKIQAIYQFYVYKNAGAEFSKKKIKDWENEKRYITTSLGKSIMKIVLKE